jgi:hypothetical protein
MGPAAQPGGWTVTPRELCARLLHSQQRAFQLVGDDGPGPARVRRFAAGMVAGFGAAFAAGFWPASLAGAGAAEVTPALLLPVLSAGAPRWLLLARAPLTHAWQRA